MYARKIDGRDGRMACLFICVCVYMCMCVVCVYLFIYSLLIAYVLVYTLVYLQRERESSASFFLMVFVVEW